MRILFLVVSLFLTSCSGTNKKPEPVVNSDKILKSFTDVSYGPSKKSSSFVDVSEELGLSNYTSVRNYAYDLNGDGKQDLIILPDQYSSPVFLEQTASGFNVSKTIFFEGAVKASFLIIDDFNRDGIPDILVGVHNQKTELTKQPLQVFLGHKSRGNLLFKYHEYYKFVKKMPVTSVSLFDYDYDGVLDIFIGNWYDLSNGDANAKALPDELFTYKNKVITNISGALEGERKKKEGEYINAAPTFGVSHCDLNGDGLLDILVTNSSGYPNKLWMGKFEKGIYTFEDVGSQSGFSGDIEGKLVPKGNGNSTYSVCTDYNNDGIMDIALGEVSHSYDNENRDRSSILTGEGLGRIPTFIRTDYTTDDGSPNWDQGDQRGVWFDYNNDGLQDLLVENSGFPNKSRLVLFHQHDDHSFQDLASTHGIDIVNPSGVIVFDYNNDGKEDILVSQVSTRNSKIKKRIYLFKNNTNNSNNSITVSLKGKKSNISGIGAKVIVTAKSGETQSRYFQPSYGPFPSQNSQNLIFGLGVSQVQKIEVIWPTKNGKELLHRTYKEPFNLKFDSILLEE